MGSVSFLSPADHKTISDFLFEATGHPIEGVRYERDSAGGMILTVGYKDIRGNSHTKKLTSPIVSPETHVDLAVMMSEWLNHGATQAMDMMSHG